MEIDEVAAIMKASEAVQSKYTTLAREATARDDWAAAHSLMERAIGAAEGMAAAIASVRLIGMGADK